MNTVKTFTKSEPVISAALIGALAGGLISLLIAFGVPVDGAQAEAILNLVEILAPVIAMGLGALVARSKVTRNTHVLERQDGDRVVAGEANEAVAPGGEIRKVGSLRASD